MIYRPYSKKLPKANIQAEFYKQCKDNNINVCLEYKYNNCRFDAIVYDKYNFVWFIVEIKNYKHPKKGRITFKYTKQYKKYSSFHTELILITCMKEVKKYVKYIKNKMNK